MSEIREDSHVIASEDPRYKPVRTNPPYTPERAEEILTLFSAGDTLAEICRKPGMPSYEMLLYWMRNNEGFKQAIKDAREVRAIALEDTAIDAANKAVEDCHPDDLVSASRLKFDANKWGAEVNNPSVYGKKTTVSGDPNRPLTFIISTGFPPPNSFQQPPKLGADGLIERTIVDVAIEENPDGFEPDPAA